MRIIKSAPFYLKTSQKLFCPGPVNVARNVRDSVATFEIGHREKEFSMLLKDINKKLLDVYEINEQSKYMPVILTGSGTAANECVLSSAVGTKNILVVSNGEFGERLAEISSIHNPNTFHLKFAWGEPFNLKLIESWIKQNNIQFLAVVHHETCTGMLNPILKIGALTKKYEIVYMVDTVSSAGAEKVEIEKANIAFCTSSASKAIGSLPGVAFVIGKKSEFFKIKSIPPRTAYLNLYKFYQYAVEKAQTPNTPAVQSFFGLNQALANILDEGVAERRKHIKKMTTMLRDGMKKMGFKFLLETKHMSSVLTTVMVPQDMDIEDLKTQLREFDIIVYNGKGPIANKVFQVGNIGDLSIYSVTYFLDCLERCLNSMKTIKKLTKRVPFLTPSTHKPVANA